MSFISLTAVAPAALSTSGGPDCRFHGHHGAVCDPPHAVRAPLQSHTVLAVCAATRCPHLAGHPAGPGKQAPAGTDHFPGALYRRAVRLVPDDAPRREG